MSEDMSATPQVAEVQADLTSAVSALNTQMEQQGKVQYPMLQQRSVLQQSSSARRKSSRHKKLHAWYEPMARTYYSV